MTTPSEKWLDAHPGTTLNDYVHAMQTSAPAAKQERFLDALQPGRANGYFKWLKTDDNGFMFTIWGIAASIPLFGFLLVAWSVWSRK